MKPFTVVLVCLICPLLLSGARAHEANAREASSVQALSLVERLMGEWRGTGTVTGRSAELTMHWSRDVGGAFVHLRFRNAMAASDTRPVEVFEGRGYYRLAAAETSGGPGTWVDSRGVIFPVTVTLSADTMTSEWGSETTERGRAVYRLVSNDEMEMIDLVRTADGEYREFGRSRLTRALD